MWSCSNAYFQIPPIFWQCVQLLLAYRAAQIILHWECTACIHIIYTGTSLSQCYSLFDITQKYLQFISYPFQWCMSTIFSLLYSSPAEQQGMYNHRQGAMLLFGIEIHSCHSIAIGRSTFLDSIENCPCVISHLSLWFCSLQGCFRHTISLSTSVLLSM
jgi:hypothetical protein